MYKIIADLHTHSIASTHAYSTVREMVDAAKEKGLHAIAITDHSNLMPGSPGPIYFMNLGPSVPRYFRDVLTIPGVEGNVIDFDGTLDVPEMDLTRLDWMVASIHNIGLEGLKNPDIDKCTRLWLGVANNPKVNIIGHSGDPKFKYDYEKVIPVFGEKGKLVEINAHSFEVRAQNIDNCREIARTCMKYGVQIVVSSDAHFETEVANFDKALHMLEEINFPEELILNASVERMEKYMREYSTVFSSRRP